jgi:phosphate transport system substrate-binding protein
MRSKQILKGIATATTGILMAMSAHAADLTGAGATFPYPIYSKWAEAYKAATGIGLNYQSIGSGGGIKQIKAKTVDFGASDMPLKAAEIVALNPGVTLPNLAITVVHRADGSGTTFLWTDFLSKTNAEFKATVGSGTAVKWPTGVGGKGNEGVAANVQRIKGAFGYIEYAYAKKNKIAHTQLKNHDGVFVQPDDETFKAAAANGDWAKTPGMAVVLTDQPGKNSWPATGASFILMHKTQAEGLTGRAVLKFFNWAYKNGATMASDLDYVPMPEPVVKLVNEAWKAKLKDAEGKAIW